METYETKLTKENLTMTKWKVSPEQGIALINAAIDLGHSPKIEGELDNNIKQLFFYEAGTFAAVCTIEDHEGYEKCTEHKEMKFDDWFGKVEIKPKEEKAELTEKIVNLSKPVELKTINDIENSYVEINATRKVSDVIANIKHEAKKHYVKFNEAHQLAGDLGESMAHAAVCHWIEHFFVMKEEKKETLSDHVRSVEGESTHMVSRDKVKGFVTEMLEFTKVDGIHDGSVYHKLKERAGKEFI